MSYLKLIEYVLNNFKSNENIIMLTKFTISQYVQFTSNKEHVSNEILAKNWDMKYVKNWNNYVKSLTFYDRNSPSNSETWNHKHNALKGSQNWNSNLGLQGVGFICDNFNCFTIQYNNVETFNSWSEKRSKYNYNYNDWRNEIVYNPNDSKIEYTGKSFKRNDIVETDKPITVYEEFNETNAIEYFVGKDSSLNILRQFIIELEQLHIEEHQKQLDENKYDKLPFELNELLQENAHKLIIKCEEHIKSQANQRKITLTYGGRHF